MMELIVSFVGLLLVAVIFLMIALRQDKRMAGLCVLLMIGLAGVSYWHWGGGFAWLAFKQQQADAERVQSLLGQFKTKADLIAGLRAKLDNRPESAKGWYLLGRLYASDGDKVHAKTAFNKAIKYWEILLKRVPADSEEARELQQAIANAKTAMGV